jgi:hypothetical protein
MKKTLTLLALCAVGSVALAQSTMNIYQNDGTVISLPTSIIDSVTFTSPPPPTMLIWQTGENPLNIMLSSIDSIIYTTGIINALYCNTPANLGTLTADIAANGVSSSVPYTGGNGQSYNGQVVSSTGVSGLTATLTGGTFSIGLGSLIYTITGVPDNAGLASFALNIGGQNCILTRTVGVNLVDQYAAGSVFCASGATAIVDVTNPYTGRTWMDRNLGASQAAINFTDSQAYGDLYQWGRRADGHQCRTSPTTNALSSTDQPTHGDFILAPSSGTSVWSDWRNPQNDSLWQGVNGTNNPCPSGYRLPTEAEWVEEMSTWLYENSFNSTLKLPGTGRRLNINNGSLNGVGVYGYYRMSSIPNKTLWIGSSGEPFPNNHFSNLAGGSDRSMGASVRCIKN